MFFTSLNFPPQMIKIFKSNNHLIIILIILVGFSFFPALDNDFVQWDDQFYVTDNPLIYHPSFENLQLLFKKIISLNYHPLTMISLWINAYFSGVESAHPFILTNILIHLLNTILVFLFIKKISNIQFSKTKSKLIGFTTALIFGIHPMHVESVAWVSERKDVLYALFFLLASLSYLNFLEKKKTRYYVLTLFLFLCSCLSKAMAVSFAPLLYLLDFYLARDFSKPKLHFEKIPFFLVALLIGMIAVNVQAGGDFYGWLQSSYDDKALNTNIQIDFFAKMKFACYGLFFYVQKFFFPFHLAAIHPYDYLLELNFLNFLPILGLVGFAGLIYFFLKNKKIAFGISYFLTTVILVLQFIPVGSAVVAERYAYLPYIGLGFLFGLFLQNFWKGKYKLGVVITLLFLTSYFSFLTRNQVNTWQNQISLFGNAVKVYPNHAASREFLATGLWLEGKLDEAIQHLDFAIHQLDYNKSSAFELLATCYDDKNESDTALIYYNRSLELDPNNFIAHYHRGLLLINQNPEAALEDFIFCEQSKSDYLQQLIHEPKARCYGLLGNHQSALKHFNQAIDIDPKTAINYYNRGVNHEKMGNFDLALKDYQTAKQLDKQLEVAHQRIALIEEIILKEK